MCVCVCVWFSKDDIFWVWEQHINIASKAPKVYEKKLKKDQVGQVKLETQIQDLKVLSTCPKPFGLGQEGSMLSPNLNGLFMICDTLVGKLNVVKFVVSVTLLIR